MTTQLAHMQAAIAHRGSSFEVIQMARPALRDGYVLVKVVASGLNPLDAKIRAESAPHARQPLPAITGLDMAGIVTDVASDVTRFGVGDAVFGMVGGVGGLAGTLAQYVVADANLLAHKPATLTWREAAATPLVAITAWEGLVDRARLRSGQRLLVQGGAGGVGHAAVQIGLAIGAEVFATARHTDAPYLLGLGATPIDFEREPVGTGFDVVYDTGGGALLDAAFLAVAPHGHVVSSLGWGTHALAPLSFKAATYSGVFALSPLLEGSGRAHHGEILREIAHLAESGRFRPRVDERVFTLHTLDAAFQLLDRRETRGKLVIDVDATLGES